MSERNSLNEVAFVPSNKMSATYALIGSDNSNVYTEINIRAVDGIDRDTEVVIRAIGTDSKDTDINIMYRGNSFIQTEIQPMGFEQLPIEIEVRPGNRMWALYEVQEPPILTAVYNPFKDAFTRGKNEYRYINYGENSSLTVGNYNGDDYRSFMQFDLSNWHPKFMVVGAKLRLHYSGVISSGTSIELLSVSKSWAEYGITRMNEPTAYKIIIDEYMNNENERYVEFELTEQVLNWINQIEENNGLLVRLFRDSIDTIVSFRSRESVRPPELLVSYYDTRIYSAGRSQVSTEIFVWMVGASDISTEIEVGSVFGEKDVLTDIYIHRAEVPVESDIKTDITVSKLHIHSEIEVSHRIDDDIDTVIDIRSSPLQNSIDTELTVSKPYQFSDIYIKHIDKVFTEITAQQLEDSDILSEIIVNRDVADSEIFVKYQDKIDTEITVQRNINDSILSEIIVNRDGIGTEIVSRVLDKENIDSDIYVRVEDENSLPSDIFVTRDSVLTEISVTYYNDIESEIFVKYQDGIDTEITVTVFNDVLTEIDVIHTSVKDTELVVTKPTIHTEIVVPFWDDSDIPTEIYPRILTISQLDTEIIVRGGIVGYAFII